VKSLIDDELFKADVQAGLSREQLTEKYHSCLSTIAKRLRKIGLKCASQKYDHTKPRMTDSDFMADVAAGLSQKELTLKYDRSLSVISKRLKKLNIKCVSQNFDDNKPRLTDEVLISNVQAGLTASIIARKYGRESSNISKRVKRLGLVCFKKPPKEPKPAKEPRKKSDSYSPKIMHETIMRLLDEPEIIPLPKPPKPACNPKPPKLPCDPKPPKETITIPHILTGVLRHYVLSEMPIDIRDMIDHMQPKHQTIALLGALETTKEEMASMLNTTSHQITKIQSEMQEKYKD